MVKLWVKGISISIISAVFLRNEEH